MIQAKIKYRLGFLLTNERIQKKYTIKEVAKALDVSPLSVCKVEQGCRQATWEMFERVLKFYHRDIKIHLKKKGTDDNAEK